MLPIAAFAKSTDTDYCKKLGNLARLYGASTGSVPATITNCYSDTKASITALESHLQAERIKLPQR